MKHQEDFQKDLPRGLPSIGGVFPQRIEALGEKKGVQTVRETSGKFSVTG